MLEEIIINARLSLTFLSAILLRPVLYFFNRNKLKSLIRDNAHITKYRIRFFVTSLSIMSLIILFLIATLPEVVIQSGLPTSLVGVSALVRYQVLLPFVNLIFLISLSIFYVVGILKGDFSTYRKWYTFLIIITSIITFILINYWGFMKLYIL
ncbi:MAG TPA: hypothetical protein VJ951_00895 [Bacteroidales bacterium]|nr:hypothetical protein [Bacteroidales bacterium]